MADNPDVLRLLASLLSSDANQSLLEQLCARARDYLEMDAVAVTLLSVPDHRQVVCATDEQVMVVEDLQFTLGDGPVIEAFRDNSVVLIPDLPAEAPWRWPLFGEASAQDPRYAGVFAFPLAADLSGPIGVMGMYSRRPRHLDAAAVAEAQLTAHAVTLAILHRSQNATDTPAVHLDGDLAGGFFPDMGGDPDSAMDVVAVNEWSGADLVVYQAVGMVIAQLRLSPEQHGCVRTPSL